jgi:hypothetical protein
MHQSSFTDLIVSTLRATKENTAAIKHADPAARVSDIFGDGVCVSLLPEDNRLIRMIYHGHLALAQFLTSQDINIVHNKEQKYHSDGRSLSLVACCVRHKSRPMAAKLAGMLLDRGATCADLTDDERTILLDMTLQVSDKESTRLREQILRSFMFLAVDLSWSENNTAKAIGLLSELLALGADHSWEMAGETILDVVCRTAQTELAEFILSRGAKVNRRNRIAVYASMSLLHKLASEVAEEASRGGSFGSGGGVVASSLDHHHYDVSAVSGGGVGAAITGGILGLIGTKDGGPGSKGSGNAAGPGSAGSAKHIKISVIRMLLENQIDDGAYRINFTRGRFLFSHSIFRRVLEEAARIGDAKCVELLMEKGTSPISTIFGSAVICNALDVAIELNQTKVASVLLANKEVASLLRGNPSPYVLKAVEGEKIEFVALPQVQRELSWMWNRVALKQRLLQMFAYFIFLIVLTNISIYQTSSNNLHHFYFGVKVKEHFVNRAITAPSSTGATDFNTVHSIDDVWNWIEKPMLTALHDTRGTYNFYQVGSARLTQLRVGSESCQVPFKFDQEIDTCFGMYSEATQSREPFGPRTGGPWMYNFRYIIIDILRYRRGGKSIHHSFSYGHGFAQWYFI